MKCLMCELLINAEELQTCQPTDDGQHAYHRICYDIALANRVAELRSARARLKADKKKEII